MDPVTLAKLGISLWGQYQGRKNAKERMTLAQKRRDLAYERSMPWSSRGPAGNVDFDPKTRQMIQSLSPEYQAMMDGFLGSSAMANQEYQGMVSAPGEFGETSYKRALAMNEDDYNETRLRAKEQAIATGRGGGTQGYYDQLAVDEGINKSKGNLRLGSVNEEMNYRNMLRAETLGFSQEARDVAGMLDSQARLGQTIGAGLRTDYNTTAIRESSNNYTNLKQGQIASILEQAGEYGDQGDDSGLEALLGMLLGGGGAGQEQQQPANGPNYRSSLFSGL